MWAWVSMISMVMIHYGTQKERQKAKGKRQTAKGTDLRKRLLEHGAEIIRRAGFVPFALCLLPFDLVSISMKIVSIDTYLVGNPWKNWLFARVSTDEGIHGVGEGTANAFGK